MINIKKVGEHIKRVREERNYSQQYLAQELGISQKAYSKIENSQTNITLSHLDRISQVLETSVNQLLGTDGSSVYNNYNTHNGEGIVIRKETPEKSIELYERIIKTQSEEITYLKSQNDILLKTIETISGNKLSN